MYLVVDGGWVSLKDVLPEGWGGENYLSDGRTCLGGVGCRIFLSGLGLGRDHIFTDASETKFCAKHKILVPQ